MAEAVTKKQPDLVIDKIQVAKPNLIARLPKSIDKERFILGILTAIQKSKANAPAGKSLADCDPNSVLLAAYDAAEVGCSLSPALQLGWLIPYGKEAVFQPSYRFFIQKAYETGEVKTFYAEVVYAGDKFERQFAPKRNLFHAPGDGERTLKARIGAYALIEFADGTIDWEYLNNEQIDRHRKHSKQPNSMKWVDFWEEGWRITPIRVLAKRLPLKSRAVEELVELVNRDADRELDLDVAQIVEPSIPRRIAETEKPKEDDTRAAQDLQPKEEVTKEQAATSETQPTADNAPSMFAADGDPDPYVTPVEIQQFWDKVFQSGWKKNEVLDFVKKTFKADGVKDLRKSQMVSALDTITQARK